MFAMINQFFAMFASFFKAGEHLGKASVNLAEWADESSAAFADEARATRKQKQLKLNHTTQQVEAETK